MNLRSRVGPAAHERAGADDIRISDLTELADTLARGKTRRDRAGVQTQTAGIVKDPLVKQILTWRRCYPFSGSCTSAPPSTRP